MGPKRRICCLDASLHFLSSRSVVTNVRDIPVSFNLSTPRSFSFALSRHHSFGQTYVAPHRHRRPRRLLWHFTRAFYDSSNVSSTVVWYGSNLFVYLSDVHVKNAQTRTNQIRKLVRFSDTPSKSDLMKSMPTFSISKWPSFSKSDSSIEFQIKTKLQFLVESTNPHWF